MKKVIIVVLISLIILQGCGIKEKEKNINISEDVKIESSANQKNVASKSNLQTKVTFKYEPKTKEEKLIEKLIVAQVNENWKEFQDIFYPAPHNISIIEYDGANYKNVTEELTILKMWQLTEAQWKEKITREGSHGNKYCLYYPWQDRLIGTKYEEIKVLAVDSYKKCTKEFDKVGQFTTGAYTDFYVLIKEDDNSSWKIFDSYMDFTDNIK